MTEQPAKPTPEPWEWVKVEGPKYVTEWTLDGPDVLCRYWYDKPPSDHARLIAAAPATAAERDRLVAENERLREALRSYAAIQPLDSKHPGEIQRDLRSIAGEKHMHVRMISDDRCLICRHDFRHEIHERMDEADKP